MTDPSPRLVSLAPDPGEPDRGRPRRTVTIARTPAELEALRSVWSTLPVRNLDSDLDHFLTVVRADPQTLRPHVLLVQRDDAPPLLVVARLVRQRFPLRIGYLDLGAWSAPTLVVSFDGVVGAETEADRREALAVLTDQLRTREAEAVLLQKLEESSPLVQTVAEQVHPWLRRRQPTVLRWFLVPPASLDELLQQRPSRSRQRIRRELATFRRNFGDRAQIRRLDLPEHQHRLEPDLDEVDRRTYQRGLGLRDGHDDLERQLRRLALEQGWLRAWMLYLDDRPVAFWWGMLYRGVLAPGSTGYDPDHAHDGVGFFTMMQMFADLCGQPDVTEIDFGYGDAEYKQRFANASSPTCDVLLFGPRPRSLLLEAGVAGTASLSRLAGAVAERSGLARSLKRRWRSRAAAKQSARA